MFVLNQVKHKTRFLISVGVLERIERKKEQKMDKKAALKEVKNKKVLFVQFWFSDIHGHLMRITRPASLLESAVEEGVGFDGSSIEGFVRICESDMRLIPDLNTFRLVPWAENKTARMFCDVVKADHTPFEGDPRRILKKATEGLKELIYNIGPEVEFFLLDQQNRFHDQAGYFRATGDLAENFRQKVMLYLQIMEILPEAAHHECAPGQHEIDIKYSDALTAADNIITLKHVIQRTAQHQGLKATFIPKLSSDKAGSGMHVHQSLFSSRGENLFYNSQDRYRLSGIAYHFIGGQIRHAKALTAVAAPTVTSYKRLKSGYEAPVHICWGQINRAALIRIPQFTPGREESVRCELRCPDPTCNPYLAFAVMLAAGLDGIKKKINPPSPVEENVYKFQDDKLEELGIGRLPSSLEEALKELKKDKIVLESLGPHASKKFLESKLQEWQEYSQSEEKEAGEERVTDWELARYL